MAMPWRFGAQPGAPWWPVYGTASWHGIALGAVCGAGTLLFLATYSASGWRLWKPLAHALLGGVCLGFVLAYAFMDRWEVIQLLGGTLPHVPVVGVAVPWYHEPGWGLYVAGGACVALLVVAALEVNALFFRREQEAGPP